VFYNREWRRIASREYLAGIINAVTQIPTEVLRNYSLLTNASLAKRMSWAADRKTSRVEHLAYCLMGIFDINMPLLYGEGEKAFVRLQQEIIKVSSDESILCVAFQLEEKMIWIRVLGPVCTKSFVLQGVPPH
jgi:hypothetical protein